MQPKKNCLEIIAEIVKSLEVDLKKFLDEPSYAEQVRTLVARELRSKGHNDCVSTSTIMRSLRIIATRRTAVSKGEQIVDMTIPGSPGASTTHPYHIIEVIAVELRERIGVDTVDVMYRLLEDALTTNPREYRVLFLPLISKEILIEAEKKLASILRNQPEDIRRLVCESLRSGMDLIAFSLGESKIPINDDLRRICPEVGT